MAEVVFPCYYSWNDLDPSEDGNKFCSECKKKVFRQGSGPANGVYCGVDTSNSEWPKRMATFNRRFLLILVICFGSSLFKNASAFTSPDSSKTQPASWNQHRGIATLSGTVKDEETHEPLMFVAVVLTLEDSTEFKTFTDSSGSFKLEVSVEKITTGTLEFTYVGMVDMKYKNIVLKPGKLTLMPEVVLSPHDDLLIIGCIIPEPYIREDHNKTTLHGEDLQRSAALRGR